MLAPVMPDIRVKRRPAHLATTAYLAAGNRQSASLEPIKMKQAKKRARFALLTTTVRILGWKHLSPARLLINTTTAQLARFTLRSAKLDTTCLPMLLETQTPAYLVNIRNTAGLRPI